MVMAIVKKEKPDLCKNVMPAVIVCQCSRSTGESVKYLFHLEGTIMAFVNRIGNVLKNTFSKHFQSESNPSLFQAIRSMSSSKLFVGGLSYNMDEMSLREAFSRCGEVVEARIIMDRDTGRSRGFGFVTYTSSDEASGAIQELDGQELQGRRIRVNYATERTRGGGFGGGFGAGGGFNYGGNYGGSGGYQGGNFGGGSGGNYPRADGNFGGEGGGYGGNNYPSGGGGFGGGSSYPGDGGFGGGNNYPSGGGGYGGESGFASPGYGGTTGTYSEGQEQVGGNQSGTGAGSTDLDRDDNDEPNDYANTRS
ncbi:RNA-binding protein [Abeliophyllum distichum]|uniref:RNA-binding protein n=1 Tax=Abeliophyllum distichum TaxID=126358 RepID=A0ABD1SX32_9LAMI